ISNGWAGQQTMNMVASAANPCGMKHGNPCGMMQGNPCNPCGMKQGNPCNPCGMKQGNPCNPCGMKQGNPCNPCGMKQSNPCSQGVSAMQITRPVGSKLYSNASRATLVKEGKHLFNSPALGTNGLSCNTCHSGTAGFGSSFAHAYPHEVAMASDRAGVQQVSADEFVQFCVVAPLKGNALAWQSRKLAALTAYVVDVKQKAFRVANANPCNPCGMKQSNPCNPCGMKSRNPCSRY
ncbi:MAG: cytochrome-c peroxidase, partial [Candidatus Polarisedimenticolaceae bacterium]|nr:cytochrome-c peroxidase [Candidatus Polarisedimenticolaceae bacterium]